MNLTANNEDHLLADIYVKHQLISRDIGYSKYINGIINAKECGWNKHRILGLLFQAKVIDVNHVRIPITIAK